MADALILGLGPAGVSAALYVLRAGFKAVLVGKDAGALVEAHKIENYYGLEAPLSGADLAKIGKKQAVALGAELFEDEVLDLMFDGSDFVASGLKGSYKGKACILATGAARKGRHLPGIADFEGKGVSYCAVCDAFFYRGKNVAVLGSGEYALHEASELWNLAASVTILTNGAAVTAEFPERVRLDSRKLKRVCGAEHFEGVELADGEVLKFDGLFVALGSASATDLARKAGAAFEGGKLVLDAKMQTTVPGLFAAGDCTGGILQVAVAVGEGAKAGLSVNAFLRA